MVGATRRHDWPERTMAVKRIDLLLGALCAAILSPSAAWAQTTGYGYGNQPHHWGEAWGWGHFLFGPIMMVVVVVLIVFLAVLAVRWLAGPGVPGTHAAPTSATKSPVDILKERFARGEIDKAEFEERRSALEG